MGRTTSAALLAVALALLALPGAALAAAPRFVRGLSIALPAPPGTLVAAEVSGDRHTDIVVAAGELIELRNAGDGGLKRHRLLALPPNAYMRDRGYQYVVAGDVNGDGRVDLVAFAEVKTPKRTVGRASNGMPVTLESAWAARTLLGTHGGRPRPGALQTLPIYLNSPTLTDLDGDGRVDLVFSAIPDAQYASGGESALFVARGRGDGSFERERALLNPVQIGDPPSGSGVIVAGDFDGDGRTDLALGAFGGVQVLPAIGTATPGPAATSPACGSAQLAAGDLDGDGRTDLAASCFYEDAAAVLLGNPPSGAQGAFGFHVTQQRATGLRPFAPALADIDGDERPDVLIPALASDEHSGFISVLRNRGGGRLAPAFHVPVNQAIAVTAADLNGDRREDIIAADVGRNLVVTAFNDPRRLPANVARAPRGARISIHTTRATSRRASATRASCCAARAGAGSARGASRSVAPARCAGACWAASAMS